MRTKYLRRTIKGTEAVCRFCKLETNEIYSHKVYISGVYTEANKLFRAIDEQTNSGFKLIAVDNFKTVEKIYRISEKVFLENAEEIKANDEN